MLAHDDAVTTEVWTCRLDPDEEWLWFARTNRAAHLAERDGYVAVTLRVTSGDVQARLVPAEVNRIDGALTVFSRSAKR